ncbi:hypothetical protein BB558_004803 [Smittium angustum]|uniref:Vacuolar protein sorting-associated protein 26 n=1 Tax=Smittium angustum TaxID=133377 RepID=A0A2U1J2B0_SMIAN|nr:hypothetical protein BB558_004803 [Smittium angustum]
MSLASFFGFGPSVDISIQLNDEDSRQKIEYKVGKDARESAPLYFDGEAVSGNAIISVGENQTFAHNGIKVEFIGTIEMFYDRGQQYNFVMMAHELAAPGELKNTVSFPFEFKNAEKQYETYIGINVKLRYFVRVSALKRVGKIEKEKDLWVHSYKIPPEVNSSIKMEVGIEDCLHIEFEYNKSKYHLKDVIVGKIYFLLVRIKIKHMELSIVRRETTGAVPNQYNESETVTKYEIMDGAPVRDEENRRYYKQQEVTIYRALDGPDPDNSLSTSEVEQQNNIQGSKPTARYSKQSLIS